MDKRVKRGEVILATPELFSLGVLNPGVLQESSQISAVYKTSTPKLPSMKRTVGEDDSLRARILRASLFPTIYSK